MSRLFERVRIKGMELENRIVMVPMVTDYGNKDGTVSDATIAYYARRAVGGAGLVVVEAAAVYSPHRLFPGQLSMDSDAYIPGMVALARAVHQGGARAAIQLHHPGRQAPASHTQVKPIAPSPVAVPLPGFGVPREMTREDIAAMVENFGRAAARVKQAGFDAVEIHGAHSYLICQFLSRSTNRRRDEYGGDVYNRSRFLQEVLRAVREGVGPDFPVIVRLSAQEFVEGGLTLEDTTVIARLAEEAGADVISISTGNRLTREWVVQPMLFPQGCLARFSQEVKRVVSVPVLVAGRINDPTVAERILERGQADLIGMGRPLLADPDLPRKAREGRSQEIRRCIACLACHHYIWAGSGLICLINPEVGREGRTEEKAATPRRVLVVGAGPAGLEAARVAALRGHQVTVWEEAPLVGGRWAWLQRGCISAKLQDLKQAGATLELRRECSAPAIAGAKPQVALVTPRLKPLVPPIPGVDQPNVLLADAVLEGTAPVGKKVAVIGGGSPGLEVAYYLANRGVQVTLLEPGARLGEGLEERLPPLLMERMPGVAVQLNARVTRLLGDQLTFRTQEGETSITVDNAVVALGYEEDTSLVGELKARGLEVHPLPACRQPLLAYAACAEGAAAARRI